MSDSKPFALLALLVVLVGGGLGALWLLVGGEGDAPEAVTVAGTDERSAAQPADGVAAAPGPARADEGAAGDGPREVVDEHGDGTEPLAFADEHADRIQGSVRLPVGTPADETMEVRAVVSSERLKAFAADNDWLELTGDEDGEVARAPVVDGRFELRVPRGLDAKLELDARYNFLEDPVAAKPGAELVPTLGAWVTGSLRLPPGRTTEGMESFELTLHTLRMSRGGQSQRKFEVEPPEAPATELPYELRAVPTGGQSFLVGDPAVFPPITGGGPKVAAGQHVVHDVDLALGAEVSGRVVDPDGAALADAKVLLEAGGMMMAFGESRSVVTDEEGRFALRAVPEGKHRLRAELEGFEDGRSEELELEDGAVLSDVEIVLGRGNHVAGKVTWPGGAPVEGARVVVHDRVSRGMGRRSWRFDRTRDTETAADGSFRVSGLSGGPFAVRAEKSGPVGGSHPGTWRARQEEVAPDAALALVLASPLAVTGRVTDDRGEPLDTFVVSAAELKGTGEGSSHYAKVDRPFEDADGAFLLDDLGPGPWEVEVTAEGHAEPTPISFELPGETPQLDFVLPRVATVAGTVLTADGATIAGASVSAFPPEDDRPAWVRNFSEQETTDAGGAFRIEDVPPGTTVVQANAEGWAPSEKTTVELLPGTTYEGLVLELKVGGTLTGEIYTDDGEPDPGRQIMVQQFTGGGSGSGGSGSSDESGRFEVRGIDPGKYQVVAIPDFDQITGGEIDEVAIMSRLKMSSVEIFEGQTTHVVLGGAPKSPVRVVGEVTRRGEALTGGRVMVLAEGKSMLESMKMARISDSGAYELTVDEPGDYTFLVSKQGGPDRGAEFPVTVPEAPEARIDLEYPSSSISGRVLASDGGPAAEVRMSVMNERGLSLMSLSGGSGVATDADGNYAFEDLLPGTYTVRARGSSKHGAAMVAGVVVEPDSEVTGVDLRLAGGGRIRGTVLGSDGRPVEDAAVFVRDEAGRLVNPISSTSTDATGSFTFKGAAPGQYTVSARKESLVSGESRVVRVVEGEASEVELVLETGTLLRISIEDGEGNTLRSNVSVLDEDGREMSRMLGQDAMQALFSEGFSTTERRVGPLAPGTYTVTATADDGRESKRRVTLKGQDERKLKLRIRD